MLQKIEEVSESTLMKFVETSNRLNFMTNDPSEWLKMNNSEIYIDSEDFSDSNFVSSNKKGVYKFISNTEGVIAEFRGIESLVKNGYLEKLYKVIFSKHHLLLSPKNRIIDYNYSKNEETVFAILDHNNLSDYNKIAGIISYLTLFRDLSKSKVLDVLESKEAKQEELKSRSRAVFGMRGYLLLELESIDNKTSDYFGRIPVLNNYASTDDGFDLINSIVSFITSKSRDKDQTFEDFIKTDSFTGRPSKSLFNEELGKIFENVYSLVNLVSYGNPFKNATRDQIIYAINVAKYISNRGTLIQALAIFNKEYYTKANIMNEKRFQSQEGSEYFKSDYLNSLSISQETKTAFLDNSSPFFYFTDQEYIGIELLTYAVSVYTQAGEGRLKEVLQIVKEINLLSNKPVTEIRRFIIQITPILLIPENKDIPVVWLKELL